jgi:hypothetical protein
MTYWPTLSPPGPIRASQPVAAIIAIEFLAGLI